MMQYEVEYLRQIGYKDRRDKMSEKPQISFPLDIPDVRVLKTDMNKHGDYVITVESTITYTQCHKCGRKIEQVHGHSHWITLRHLPILGQVVWIGIRPRRYKCPYCDNRPTTTQTHSWPDTKSPHTRAYDDYLLKCLINSTVEDVSRKGDVGYDAVEGTLDRRIERQIDWAEFKELGTIGVDEIALKRGKRDFVLIITTQQADGRVAILAVLPDRKKETARQFLESIPERLRTTIKTVCTDMWEGYINAVKEFAQAHQLPVAVVIDRFHVAQNYRQCVDNLRKRELRRLKKELPEEQYDTIKGVLWAVRKNNADLNEAQRQKLQRLFVYAPNLKQAYSFREELSAIFQMPLTQNEAFVRLQRWQKKVKRSGLSCFNSFLETLDNWCNEIANYFVKRLSSGFVEGLNNRIKTIKRRCYGLTNIGHLFQRIYLDLEGFRLFA
jgi:transposase